MWTVFRFLIALCLTYFVRRIFQRNPANGPAAPYRAILPNIISGVLVFVILSLLRHFASDGNYTYHVVYTLALVALAQAVWLLFDLARIRAGRSSRR